MYHSDFDDIRIAINGSGHTRGQMDRLMTAAMRRHAREVAEWHAREEQERRALDAMHDAGGEV